MPFFKISSDTAEAQKVQEKIIAKAVSLGYGSDDLFAMRLAITEAFMNAIKHGNRSDPGKKVKGFYNVTGAKIRIRIEDEGEGFNPKDVPDPTLPENLERPCGRGLLLMRAKMSEVVFNDRGNAVEMVLRKGEGPRESDDEDENGLTEGGGPPS